MDKRTHESYQALVERYGKQEAKKRALEAIRRRFPPKRERIDLDAAIRTS